LSIFDPGCGYRWRCWSARSFATDFSRNPSCEWSRLRFALISARIN